ncbi:MAG: ATP-binding protein [Ferruginibacter sp.]
MCFKKLKFFLKKKFPPDNPSHYEETIIHQYDQDQTQVLNTNLSFMSTNETKQRDTTTTNQPEFDYLEQLIKHRLNFYFPSDKPNNANDPDDSIMPPFPEIKTWSLPWQDFIQKNNLQDKQDELVLLLIGITPHIEPGLFDRAIEQKINGSRDFPGIGGVRGKNCRFFLPTGETVLFLIAGEDIKRRLQVQQIFGAEHLFWEKKITWLEDMQHGEPSMHGRLIISPDYVDLLTYGRHTSPQFSISFPAKKIAPEKKDDPSTFEDLVIAKELHGQIGELKNWLKFNDHLLDDFAMRNKFRQGYRTLFYGPPGTGKTFTAQILGNDLQKEVYKIDLSMIVSKYIGETEKNLELLFARAEDKGWILFFDEADALFGKRTNVRDAHDKYANQEVSYLLQRIEDYNGLVILATNMKNNIDDAFIRRFNSILKFPVPNADERKCIWKKMFPLHRSFRDKAGEPVKEEIVLDAVKDFELTGGNINNIMHYACLKAYQRRIESPVRLNCHEQASFLIIYLEDILNGIKRELTKEGKPSKIN